MAKTAKPSSTVTPEEREVLVSEVDKFAYEMGKFEYDVKKSGFPERRVFELQKLLTKSLQRAVRTIRRRAGLPPL